MATTSEPRFLRLKDLQERGIVSGWPKLRRMIQEYDFPEGRLLSPYTRVWTDFEVNQWLESMPRSAAGWDAYMASKRGVVEC